MTEFEKLEKMTAPPFLTQGRKLNFRPTQTPSMNFTENAIIPAGNLNSNGNSKPSIHDKENR